MKKLLVIGMIILLIGMSVPSTGINVEKSKASFDGNTLYVGGEGPGNYTKIQDAINDSSDGDTVYVYNGTYVENLIVDKSINLIGEDKNITTINGNLLDKYIITTTADRVNLSRFTIEGNNSKCLFIISSYNNISNNIICQTTGDIIIGTDEIYNILYGNNISTGVYSWSSTTLFLNNIVTDFEKGFITDFFNGTISGNRFNNCSWGIIGEQLYDSTVSGNHFTNIKHDAISLRFLDRSKILDNIFINNNYGIDIFGKGSDSVFSGNTFINIEEHCINIGKFRDNTKISQNFIYDSGVGILLGICNDVNISFNTISNNTNGIIMLMSNYNKVYKNNFNNNTKDAYFYGFSLLNRWNGNFWDKSNSSPYIIFGNFGWVLPWINFDWHPAQEPYDIGV